MKDKFVSIPTMRYSFIIMRRTNNRLKKLKYNFPAEKIRAFVVTPNKKPSQLTLQGLL